MNINNIKSFFPLYVAVFLIPFMNMPPYVDDFNRFSSDVLALATQGRLLTEYAYTVLQGFNLHFFPEIYYFSLCYIFAISALTYGLVLKKHNKEDHPLIILFFISIFSSPAIIQNISFHIDSVGMFSAIYLAVVAGFCHFDSRIKTILLSTLFICLSTIFYQISFNYYVISLSVYILISSLNGKIGSVRDVISTCIIKAIPLVASVAFALYIKHEFITNSYFTDHSKFASISQLSSGILYKNLSDYYSIISGSFNFVQICCILTIIAIYIALSIMLIASFIRGKRFHLASVYILLPLVFLSMLLLPSILLISPVLEQRAIPLYGTLFFVLLSPVLILKIKFKIIYIPYAIFLATMIMTVAAFTSSQKYAVERNLALMNRLYAESPDAYKSADGTVNIKVAVQDYPDYIGPSKRNIAYFPALKYLMRDYFRSDYASSMFNDYYDTGVKIKWDAKQCLDRVVLKQSYRLKFYRCNEDLYVSFR